MIEGVQSKLVSSAVNAAKSTAGDSSATDVSESFGQYLSRALNGVADQRTEADNLTAKFITGEVADVHKVMIAAEKASLGVSLTVQVRNKVIEAYQEIMRTQI